ncbi:hypothetical protein, partial [Vibrio breoganii]|uniref:hypothetical protein n=1 Tax=Vibrio breoganii TaxID=553239 RepID=UPI0018E4CEF9
LILCGDRAYDWVFKLGTFYRGKWFWVLGSGFWVLGSGFWVLGSIELIFNPSFSLITYFSVFSCKGIILNL